MTAPMTPATPRAPWPLGAEGWLSGADEHVGRSLPPPIPLPPQGPLTPGMSEALPVHRQPLCGALAPPAPRAAGAVSRGGTCAAGRTRVLSIDGGATSGLAALELLAALEHRLRRGSRTHQPLGAHFDRLVGTSVGAIIAAALAFPDPETGEPRSADDALRRVEQVLKHAFRHGEGEPCGARDLFRLPTLPVQELEGAFCELGFDRSTKLSDAVIPLDLVCYPSGAEEPRVLSSTDPGSDIGLVDALEQACGCPPFGPRRKGAAPGIDEQKVLYRNPTAEALDHAHACGPGQPCYVVSVGARPQRLARILPPVALLDRSDSDEANRALTRRLEVQIPPRALRGSASIDDSSLRALGVVARQAARRQSRTLDRIAGELLHTPSRPDDPPPVVPLLGAVCAPTRSTPSPVRVSGRQLLVDGKPYEMRGVCWNPVPIGGTFPQDLDYAGYADDDIALMHRAGVNTVRLYAPLLDREVLDKLYAHGIRVINTVYDWAGVDMDTLAERVEQVKDHPAILMWALGNEWNYNGLWKDLSHDECIERIRRAAQCLKEVDPSHPITTIYGEQPSAEVIASLPEIDLWGLNIYRGKTFGSLFREWSKLTDKPVLIAECGTDAWDSRTDEYNPEAQEEAVVALVEEAFEHSSARHEGRPEAVCIGVNVFAVRDEWWKHVGGRPDVHNTEGVAMEDGGPYPDSVFNEEWFGLITAEGDSRPAWEALALLYCYYRDSLDAEQH